MEISEERIFVEKPFDVLKVVIPTLVIMLIGAALIAGNNGPPKSPRSPVKTVEGLIFFFFCVEVFILLIVSVVMSFIKKRTIVCDSKGCRISGADFWGNPAADENFLWNEVTDTNLVRTNLGRGGQQLNFMVTAKGKETRMLSRSLLNRRDFDELIEVINQSTPHLSSEPAAANNAGTRAASLKK
jgi:hypothetical protein